MLAMVLQDMQAAGLIDLTPGKEMIVLDKEISLAPEVQVKQDKQEAGPAP